jgi:L-amino acid N-acyltransferase YncA
MNGPVSEKHRLPQEFVIKGHRIVLRTLEGNEGGSMETFARNLPTDDLLFLHRDITKATEIDAWIREVDEGNNITIVAWEGSAIQGYATFDRGRPQWSRHVAEIGVVVSESVRGLGIGRLLLEMAFKIALEVGVLKVVAQMTPEQLEAIELFRRLGFELEATLRDHAAGAHGCKHDLLVYSYFAQHRQDLCCESCGDRVMAPLTLEGARLCAVCYNTKYAELGGGD